MSNSPPKENVLKKIATERENIDCISKLAAWNSIHKLPQIQLNWTVALLQKQCPRSPTSSRKYYRSYHQIHTTILQVIVTPPAAPPPLKHGRDHHRRIFDADFYQQMKHYCNSNFKMSNLPPKEFHYQHHNHHYHHYWSMEKIQSNSSFTFSIPWPKETVFEKLPQTEKTPLHIIAKQHCISNSTTWQDNHKLTPVCLNRTIALLYPTLQYCK